MFSLRKCLVMILAWVPLAGYGACKSNQALMEDGWVIHSGKKFERLATRAMRVLEDDAEDFVADTEGRWMDHDLYAPVLARSFDRISTPQTEMYGDLFVIEHSVSGELLEVRWYDGKKHLAYNAKYFDCARAIVPAAANTLF